MKPIDFEHSNTVVGGEIPVNRSHGIVLSLWQACWRERLKILLTGKVWLAVKGDVMPPTLMSGDLSFRIENPPAPLGQGRNKR